MRTLLLGEAPPQAAPKGQTWTPFSGESGRRLREMLSPHRLTVFDLANLLQEWPGKGASKGSTFPTAQARKAADLLLERDAHETLILVGRRVAKAIGLPREVPYLTWTNMELRGRMPTRRVAILPHPSGVNRWYNHEENVSHAKAFLRSAARRSAVHAYDNWVRP